MIISNTLACTTCKKRLCECPEHLVYDGKSFCSRECVLDYIDDDILLGEPVESEEQYEFIEKNRLAQW